MELVHHYPCPKQSLAKFEISQLNVRLEGYDNINPYGYLKEDGVS